MHLDRQVTPVASSASSSAGNNERALVLSPARSPSLPATVDRLVNTPAYGHGSAMPRLQAVPAQEVHGSPTNLQLALPRALSRIPRTPLTLPSISQLGLGTSTCAFQTAAPPRLSLGDGYRGSARPLQSQRYLTHPPNAVPAMVTEPMRHLGLRANGHHVWSVPTGPNAAAQYPSGRAPDTPRLPLRMLDDAPELTRREVESDAEMPDAGDTDAEGSTEDEEVSASYERWAVSNCRLEKIQTAARRLSEDPSLSRDEAPKYVLNALQLEVATPDSPEVKLTLEDLANAIDDVLAYRFYEPVIIRNLLEAGMLDPNDTIYVDGGPPGGIKIEARNVTGYPKVREWLFRPFRGTKASLQPKRPFPGRYPRNWTQQVMVPSPIPEGFEDDDSSDEHAPDAGEPVARRAKLLREAR
ncbi:hypothetical protein C8R47DRAFT_1082128 [Mycena vitilis]|nr:hypothetical protein C8R47DRAFT_1082128 [Mycena vitilis]